MKAGRRAIERARRRWSNAAIRQFFELSSRVGRIHPAARKKLSQIPQHIDVVYGEAAGHTLYLDVYGGSPAAEPKPAVLYIHGGGFSMFSKSTHWLMALMFARRGYVVFNIDYRLAPKWAYPAAIEDACRAYRWIVDNGHRYGADPSRIVVAGESAGGDLALGVAVSACFERRETFARAVFETEQVPVAVLPACPLLEISSVDRYQAGLANAFERGVLRDVRRSYARFLKSHPKTPTLADPLLIIEGSDESVRPLPPMCSIVGTLDCLKDDVRRLGEALRRRYVPHEMLEYKGGFMHFMHFRCSRPLVNAGVISMPS